MLAKLSLKSLRTMLEAAEQDPDKQDVLLITLNQAAGITFEQPAKDPGACSNFFHRRQTGQLRGTGLPAIQIILVGQSAELRQTTYTILAPSGAFLFLSRSLSHARAFKHFYPRSFHFLPPQTRTL